MNYILLFVVMSCSLQTNNKRILAIYARNEHNADYLHQLQVLEKDAAGLKDRDLVIEKHIYRSSTVQDFKKHHLKSDFTVILTGKDGGEKFRDTKPITLKHLYGMIDAMPMRKQEMKRRQ